MFNAFIINTILVSLAVAIHYECLRGLTKLIPRLPLHHRLRIVVGVCGALVAHSIEIWVFALGFYWMNQQEAWGQLTGNFDGSLFDCAYFSFTVYTTLGFGDIQPEGLLRYLTGIEALTGLVLITWSASFLYVEMQRHWQEHTQ